MPPKASYEFGPFRLDPARRELTRGPVRVLLRAKPFDLLLALAEKQGKTVSKAALMSRVWPGSIVSDVNFHVTLNMVRRALGDSGRNPRYILRTGTGYRLSVEGPLKGKVAAN
jgi:DNA-binding winged helix-turn-helix (wHTH) protein